jgi:26S proteasome regulatory subunit N3
MLHVVVVVVRVVVRVFVRVVVRVVVVVVVLLVLAILTRAAVVLRLVCRLRRNVIKTGLRKINLSYSRISFADICAKLHLDSEVDAEFIVAKAIRDGVIDATIDHENRYLRSKELVDIYSTYEPQDIFHQRIKFCLKLHNDAVMVCVVRISTALVCPQTSRRHRTEHCLLHPWLLQAMRFPPDAYKNDKETEEARKERLKQEAELAKEIAEEEDEDDEL